MNRLLFYSLTLGALLTGILVNIRGQDLSQTRSITSDDFTSRRPVRQSGRTPNKKPNLINRPPTYNLVKQNRKAVRRASGNSKSPQRSKSEKIYELGVTMWKLRPARSSDNGFKLPVLVNNSREMWTAERVEAETVFRPGDRVRFAVESSFQGYLYIINSELFSDESIGTPFLIFPESEKVDNSVRPGLMVDIPDQREDLPYFLIDPKNPKYKGELLTVIISPQPLTWRTDQDGRIKSLDELIDLENNAEAEIYNRGDLKDRIYSQLEAESACGSKTRLLTPKKSAENPCGAKTRQLTREDPPPQTIYRIKGSADRPVATFIRILVDQ